MPRANLLVSLLLTLSLCPPLTIADLFTGSWKSNRAKSTYDPGPAPPPSATAIQKIEATAEGLHLSSEGVNGAGQKTHVEFTVKWDGKDYPYTEMADGKIVPGSFEVISGKKIDDRTVELTFKIKGQIVSLNRNVVSADGKTRTVTQTGKLPDGRPFKNVVVWDKQ